MCKYKTKNKKLYVGGKMKKIVLALTVLTVASMLFSQETIYVDWQNTGFEDGSIDHPWNTIQEGIDDAEARDTVIVGDGVYEENMLTIGPEKLIKLHSENNNPETCTIKPDPSLEGVLTIDTHQLTEEDRVSVKGFTITCEGTTENTHGVYIGDSHVDFSNCLIRDNEMCGIFSEDNISSTINNCTIVANTGYGIFGEGFTVSNTITYFNEQGQIESPNNSVNYSDIEGGYNTGTGNIDANPIFCDLENYEYRLLEGSPCIDTGDPNEEDDDETRIDMGCYPTTTDMKWSKGKKWNWISFPRLQRVDNDPVIASEVLEDLIPLVEMNLLYELEELTYHDYTWNPPDFPIQSSNCYKFYPQDIGYYHLPLPGSRLEADHVITLEHGQDNWIGYYIPHTQDIDEAFYDTEGENRWDDIYSIKAEDWTYLDMSSPRDEGEPRPSMEIRPLYYGKGYIVRVKETFELVWNDPVGGTGSRNENEYPEPEFYTFLYKPDYEVIDVMDIDENILEIGVFENGICVGAVVVNEPAEQILVYSDEMNREDFELTFEAYYGRGRSVRISNYLVYDERNKKFFEGSIIGGNQEYSMIKLGKPMEPGEEEIPGELILYQNYPNPFNLSGNGANRETLISCQLPEDNQIEISVYNLKGQKVKTLYNGKATSGRHSILWNGTDDIEKQVSTGIYFYKLITPEKVISRKMLLMK